MPDYLPAGAYLPHNAPMILLDEVIAVAEESVHCCVTVDRHGVLAPFLTADGDLPSWFVLEIMAQSVSVWSGWHQSQRGEAVAPLGLLLGCRALHSQAPLIQEGSRLDSHLLLLTQDQKFGSFEGKVSCSGETLATVRLNIYQPDPQQLQQLFQWDKTA